MPIILTICLPLTYQFLLVILIIFIKSIVINLLHIILYCPLIALYFYSGTVLVISTNAVNKLSP